MDHDWVPSPRTVPGEEDVTCLVCGVEVGQAKNGRWLHLDDVPEGAPDHEVSLVDTKDYAIQMVALNDVRSAATDLLTHHATFHPSADCPWSERMFRALQG